MAVSQHAVIPMFEYQKLLDKARFKKKGSVSFGDRIEAILKSKLFSDDDKIQQILTIINNYLGKNKPVAEISEPQRDLQDDTDAWDNDLTQEVVVKNATPETSTANSPEKRLRRKLKLSRKISLKNKINLWI